MTSTLAPQLKSPRPGGRTDGLKRMVAEPHEQPPTLDAVSMTYTGRSLDDDIEEAEEDDDAQE